MRINKSNLLYFFLFLLLNTIYCSCSKTISENDIIPYVHVNGVIYLNSYSELNVTNNALYFDEIEASVGYNAHGFLVVRTSPSEFAVFDASCTNDIDADEHLEIEGVLAICPICNSKFNLIQTGNPIEGPAEYKLKEYRSTYFSSRNELRVRN